MANQEKPTMYIKEFSPYRDDIAELHSMQQSAPEHVQIAEVLVLATHQANGTVIDRNPDRVEHLS